MKEMNFSLEGLDQLEKDVEEIKKELEYRKKEELKNRKIENFTNIINGVAKKYASKWCDEEDLAQEIWVKIIEAAKYSGGFENLDERLVARLAWNRAVDIYRYNRRRYESKCEYIEGSSVEIENFDSKYSEDYFDSLHTDKFPKAIDMVIYKEVIDLFDIGSRERKYVVLKLVNNGVIDFRYLDDWDKEIYEKLNGNNEEDYIRALGYKSYCPGSWTCKKREIKRVVKEYLS